MRWHDEIPTAVLLVLTYGAFAGLGLAIGWIPLPLIILGLSIIIAQHSSLQHEVLHGHPFPYQTINDALVFPALGLFIPYMRFKDTHLAHHHDPNLTDPYDDPETNFLDAADWRRMSGWQQQLFGFNNTLIGRMLVGPALSLAAFYRTDLGKIRAGDGRVLLAYGLHIGGMSIAIGFLSGVAGLPIWAYVSAAYLGMSWLKIRTFLEHQAHDRAAARSVIIEDRGPLALLFLNNNYHAVHHAHPQIVWHKLPKVFAQKRDLFLRRNGGYSYKSYGQIFGQYALRQKDPVAHPFWSRENRTMDHDLTK
ncbi:fatty acid desaturase [Algirhabdus cladophorae]|uniref:fatty acid desaturase n=1 Tax=Algirhabdus cladophorae TaxID=3377108 RepID=UPI003B848342